MGKKIKCRLTPRGRKSKDQGGGKKSKVVQLYTPLQNTAKTSRFEKFLENCMAIVQKFN